MPNRTHIVITRNRDYTKEGCIVVHNLEDALKIAEGDTQPFIIGGGEIYKLALNASEKIELTRVHDTFEADAFFPEIDLSKWELINEEFHEKDERHSVSFTYLTYVKKTAS